ncbi:YkgJ family cysteine cluster protein [Enhygromyxa salina]|uniref:Flagellin N-methylase n=1 Tax=Enhygromyxa salina TaxID=215803 RepID=A0A2S9YBZ1_9BACT|nr:YkgJ family cysteine cluster protein [Enhygromyxa salina]PRQ02627.1 Flagellin N-methylase [Enhygromyxa salina]
MLNFIAALFGPRVKLPRDRVTRIARRARKQAKEHVDTMQRIVDEISGLPGLADTTKTKRLPRGFYDRVDDLHTAYDRYVETVRGELGLADAAVPGTPAGKGGCYAAPFGVSGPETLAIYREVRTWKDFPQVAQRLGELGEQQFKDIQAGHTGKDPEKIRMTSKAAGRGRQTFAERGQACPFLDEGKGRCRIWERRPISCRMHHIVGDSALADPRHERHADVEVVNIRLPVRPQVTLSQIDKRMELGLSPFLYASVLQLLQLGEGELLQEVGEAPRRMQQDGRVVQKANRNVKHAKKHQKKNKQQKKKRK